MPDAEPLELNGLDAANPLGFLAALGTLALCDRMGLNPRMGWVPRLNSYRPELWVDDAADLAERMAAVLHNDLNDKPPAWCDGAVIKRPNKSYRCFADHAANAAKLKSRHEADFAAAFASDAVTEDKTDQVTPTRFSFANGQSGKLLLRDYRDLIKTLAPEHLHRALEKNWQNTDLCKAFRWDPRELRLYALRADAPAKSKVFSTHGANVLAFWGLTLLPAFPTARGELATTGFARHRHGGQSADSFSWPVWASPCNCDMVESILQQPAWHQTRIDPLFAAQRGVFATFRCQRIHYQKSLYFSFSEAV